VPGSLQGEHAVVGLRGLHALAVVTNGHRAMVLLVGNDADAGTHAITPEAAGESSGYMLENGQEDTYADRDTVSLDDALRAVVRIVETGQTPDDQTWS
jgi:hypothetical protein